MSLSGSPSPNSRHVSDASGVKRSTRADDRSESIAAFVRSAGFDPADIPTCVAFASEPDVQTQLAELVVADIKRATTALYHGFADGKERLPEAGDLFVVLDGLRRPRCLCRMLAVDIAIFEDVDEAFAFTEGEADRTLQSWRAIHTAYFEDEARAAAFAFRLEASSYCNDSSASPNCASQRCRIVSAAA